MLVDKYQHEIYQQGGDATLTDSQIKKIKILPADQNAPDKYSDGDGLQLHVLANGGTLFFACILYLLNI